MSYVAGALGWAIVGIGRHADRFMAPAIKGASGARLVAVYSRDQGRAGAFAQRHGAPYSYTSLEELLANPEVQAVCIASPNALHAPQTIAAARAGKHVLCEKPMATTVEDARAMVQACAAGGVKLGVGFHLRHHPAHIEAQRLIASGVLGEITLAWAQWCPTFGIPAPRLGLRIWWDDLALAGGGVVVGWGGHVLDLLRFLLRQEVVEVAAFTDASEQHPLERQATILLRFGGGVQGLVATSLKAPAGRNDVAVHGTLGSLFSLGAETAHFRRELALVREAVANRTEYLQGDMYQAEVESFCQAVLTDSEPSASGLDGLRVVEITQAIMDSHRQRRAVRLASP